MVSWKKVDPLRETYVALYKVKQGISRFEVLMDKISIRKDRLLEYAVQLESRGERYLAKKTVEEAGRLNDLYVRIAGFKLILEKVSSILEYIIVTHNYRTLSTEVLNILKDLKSLPESAIPDVNIVLSDLELSLMKLSESEYSVEELDFNPVSNSDVERILNEAREIYKTKLKVPEPPG